jgi:hypothetical protein
MFAYSNFKPTNGPGATPSDRSKSCTISFSVGYPAGYKYRVQKSVDHGYARLHPGATLSFSTTYFFTQNASATASTMTSINGDGVWGAGQVYTKQDTIPDASAVWSPCGLSNATINIIKRVSLTQNGPVPGGELAVEYPTTVDSHEVTLGWDKC